jgi:NAD-dependent dihydropyrimidine dehydrogenase PreA subunit
MANNWYPIIDYNKRINCLQCYTFCPHEVFVQDKDSKIKVMRPENCVEFCKGCGKICEQNAILFYGDK